MFKTTDTVTVRALSDIPMKIVFCCEADPPERSTYSSPVATGISTKVMA